MEAKKCGNWLIQLVYVTVSAKNRLVRTFKNKIFTQQYQQCPRNGQPKFQPSVACSFGIIVIDSRKSKVIYLYSDYTENKLQALFYLFYLFVLSSQPCWYAQEKKTKKQF